MNDTFSHIPVMHDTVLQLLQPAAGESVLDVTVGLGGHSASFSDAIGSSGKLIVLDADKSNLDRALSKLSNHPAPVAFHQINFLHMGELSLPSVDIIFADLGLSSPHIDDPARGFTFRAEGPLDLRYDQSSGRNAMQWIEEADEEDLAQAFRSYGELYKEARRLASVLAGKRFETTTMLRDAVEKAFGFRAKQILPQVFQALRIAVNDELLAVEALLNVGSSLLNPGGRMGILSYHSLEDRLVKHAFRALTAPKKNPVTGKISREADFELVTKKALVPSDGEIAANQRSRSAKFRVIKRKS
ncbi:MAG TPA: 16S rRNA (cytosine(1402)-N(4))-methyltransferase RsmH [Candidatus Peribacteraceae bacterium]|nr:16S rRNA (cytosine(1402)-N(4))-methyltransferase RsmH [Candidatus Peribacteraceae bacterium]